MTGRNVCYSFLEEGRSLRFDGGGMNHGNVRVFVYGSLVFEPRQFKDHIAGRESMRSWFNVEYARCFPRGL